MYGMRIQFCNIFWLSLVLCATQRTPYQYHVDVRGSAVRYKFEWNVTSDQERLRFRTCLHSKRLGELSVFGVAFGLQDVPNNLDMVMIVIPWTNEPVFAGGFTDSEGIIHIESQATSDKAGFEWELLNKDQLCFAFERRALSCSPHGYSIDDQTTRVFLFQQFGRPKNLRDFYNYEEPYSTGWWNRTIKPQRDFASALFDQRPVHFSSLSHSLTRVQLIKSPLENALQNTYVHSEVFELTVGEVEIPKDKTTYWCKTDKLPQFDSKYHIIRYEPIIPESSHGFVHHMEVFLCTGAHRVRQYNGPCNSETKPMGLRQCRQVIGAWAMGATGLTMPREAGIAIGGVDQSQDVVIEMHYNNPNQVRGKIDNSGFRFFVTSQLRKFDVGVIELGLVYSPRNSIPPGQKMFKLSGYCGSQCTDLALPSQGITVFASQLHTHERGRKVVTYHLRNGRRLADLNRDEHYSPHFQEIRRLQQPVQVHRGDTLVTTCTYDTATYSDVIFGGLGQDDEMCLNYIFYYPKIDLELCKSEVSQPELDDFLQRILGDSHVRIPGSVEDKFNSVNWMKGDHAEKLAQFYSKAMLEMHCNSSTGTRIPGSAAHVMPVAVPKWPIPNSLLNKLKCLLFNN
uniref:Dopamine beta-hydroxylase n=1 Tax=Cryptocotyle lingua TaxID=66766 RepID=A0A7U0YER8_9TREM|nr:dopamine beta-hydroxylase [Cryptocotyle lingua]